VDPLCSSFDFENNVCVDCYEGYCLHDGKCVLEEQPEVDVHCVQYAHGVCTKCVNRYFLSHGACTAVNPLCKTFNSAGACESCWSGFSLNDGDCIKNKVAPSIIGCSEVNKNGFVCDKCNKGYLLIHGRCAEKKKGDNHPELCQTFDGSYNCLSCFDKFFLEDGDCCVNKHCEEVNPENFECVKCKQGYELEFGLCFEY